MVVNVVDLGPVTEDLSDGVATAAIGDWPRAKVHGYV